MIDFFEAEKLLRGNIGEENKKKIPELFIGILFIYNSLRKLNFKSLLESGVVLPNGLIHFPLVDKINTIRSLLRFSTLCKIFNINYPEILPLPEKLISNLSPKEKNEFLEYVLSETVVLPKFEHPVFSLIPELNSQPINIGHNKQFLLNILTLFTFDKKDFLTQSDLGILEIKKLLNSL